MSETIEVDQEDYTLENVTQGQVITYCVTKAEIAKLADKYKDVPSDLSVKENYEFCRVGSGEIRGLRSEVEKRRKELKADALAWGKKVDGTAKEITALLIDIEEPMATAKKEYDTAIEVAKREAALAEEKRVDGIAARIAMIQALPAAHISSTSEVIGGVIDELAIGHAQDCQEWAMEFSDKANLAIMESSASLKELYTMKLDQEQAAAKAAEAEKARLEQVEADRIRREKELEEDRIKIAAERKAMEEERTKLAAEQAERDAIIKAEQEAAAKVQAEKDAYAEAERAKMSAEIEALKKSQAEKDEAARVAAINQFNGQDTVQVPEETKAPSPVPEQVSKHLPKPGSEYGTEAKAALNAMLAILLNNKVVTKELFEAIVKGEIPNIIFTGEI